jgi:hypothetical protein
MELGARTNSGTTRGWLGGHRRAGQARSDQTGVSTSGRHEAARQRLSTAITVVRTVCLR